MEPLFDVSTGLMTTVSMTNVLCKYMISRVRQYFTELLVQLFYSWRIKVLTRQSWASVLIVLLSIMSFGMYSRLVVSLIHAPIGLSTSACALCSNLFDTNWTNVSTAGKTTTILWYALSVTVDILIATILVIYLVRRFTAITKSRTLTFGSRS